MINSSFLLRALGLVLVLLCIKSQAQTNSLTRERLTIYVEGLSSETRDDLARELKRTGDAHIAFACVPAGIVVLEARQGFSRAELESRTNTILSSRVNTARTRRTDLTIAQAEAACEQARNR